MKTPVQNRFKAELDRAKTAIAQQDFDTAWIALQRAHMLGQKDAIAHTLAHGHMLALAWKQRDFQEIKDQLMPTLLAFPLTIVFGQMRKLRGGKASPSYAQSNSVPEDIQHLLD
ncbi:DUF3703 domain-containing protein [Nodosilinea nodulosa]|uniref:DUF3703 domain-containing protein n=1 Tax=Nodosilinea nodulosa TaxID=416001 RepID=UPI00037F300C|nr:DUF3703 domain-containing protein [Nodosilinea nodulosa]